MDPTGNYWNPDAFRPKSSPQRQASVTRTTAGFPYEQRDTCQREHECFQARECAHDDYDQCYTGHRDVKTGQFPFGPYKPFSWNNIGSTQPGQSGLWDPATGKSVVGYNVSAFQAELTPPYQPIVPEAAQAYMASFAEFGQPSYISPGTPYVIDLERESRPVDLSKINPAPFVGNVPTRNWTDPSTAKWYMAAASGSEDDAKKKASKKTTPPQPFRQISKQNANQCVLNKSGCPLIWNPQASSPSRPPARVVPFWDVTPPLPNRAKKLVSPKKNVLAPNSENGIAFPVIRSPPQQSNKPAATPNEKAITSFTVNRTGENQYEGPKSPPRPSSMMKRDKLMKNKVANVIHKLINPPSKWIKFTEPAWERLLAYWWMVDMFPLPARCFNYAAVRREEKPHPLENLFTWTELQRLIGETRLLPMVFGQYVLVDDDLMRRVIFEFNEKHVKPLLEEEKREEDDFIIARGRRQTFAKTTMEGLDVMQFYREHGFYPF